MYVVTDRFSTLQSLQASNPGAETIATLAKRLIRKTFYRRATPLKAAADRHQQANTAETIELWVDPETTRITVIVSGLRTPWEIIYHKTIVLYIIHLRSPLRGIVLEV